MAAVSAKNEPQFELVGKHSLRWWLGSVILHLLVLLLLFQIPAVRRAVLQPKQENSLELAMTPERADTLAEKLQDLNAEDLRGEVERLAALAAEMARERQAKDAEFKAVAEQFSAQAPAKALAALDEALRLQQDTLDHQDETAKAADRETRQTKQDSALRTQVEVQEAQNRAQYALEALAGRLPERVQESQRQARAAQQTADARQLAARQLTTEIANAEAQLRNAERALEHATARLNTARTGVENKKRDLARDETRRTQAQEAQGRAQTASVEADAKRQATETKAAELDNAAKANPGKDATRAADDARKAAGKAVESVTKARAALAKASQAVADAESAVEKSRGGLTNATHQAETTVAGEVEASRTAWQARQAALEALRGPSAVRQAEARDAQAAARTVQEAARTSLAQAVAQLANPSPTPGPATRAPVQPTPPDLAGRDVVDLYARAVELEHDITSNYREIRAAELAMIREIPLSEARNSTDPVQTRRPALDAAAVRNPVRTGKGLQAFKEQVIVAHRETLSMVSLAETLLGAAKSVGGADSEEGLTTALADLQMRAEDSRSADADALQDANQRAKDLTGNPAATGPTTPGPETADGNDREGGTPGPKLANTQEIPKVSYPKLTSKTPLIPGRKVLASGTGAPWMIVESWYTIGPFPNPERRFIDKRFPPESVIDLDGTYLGKDDRVLRWKYVQSPLPSVCPADMEEYAIYYAYTELYFERPMDLWIAFGSDDKSTIWINGQPVWESAGVHKNWRLDEGYRKVHFEQGFNRVLYRIENGHGWCAFSLALCINPDQG